MVPNGSAYANYPPFANNGTKTPPGGSTESAKYALGMVPADTFPAEWANYLFHGATAGITRLNADTGSIKKEINNVLDNFNITPDATLTNQFMSALNKLKQEAVLEAHPVGSLYWTNSAENPAVTFGGGTWSRIKDKFVYAMGDNDTLNATGGAKTVTLTSANLPKHTHSFTPSGTVSSHSHGLNGHTHSFKPSGTVSPHNHALSNMGSTPNANDRTIFTGTEGTVNVSGGNHTHAAYVEGSTTSTGIQNFYGPKNKYGILFTLNDSSSRMYSKTNYQNNNLLENSGDLSMSGSFTPSGTVTGFTRSATLSFTGTAGTTGENSGNTTSTQPTFTGTAGTTGDGGFSNTAVDKMPPYICKFCWERTA